MVMISYGLAGVNVMIIGVGGSWTNGFVVVFWR